MKKKIRHRVGSYTAVFEPAPEGGYVVYVPALPGCSTQGDTFESARRNAQDAVEGYLVAAQQLNEEVPIESDGTIIARVVAAIK